MADKGSVVADIEVIKRFKKLLEGNRKKRGIRKLVQQDFLIYLMDEHEANQ